MCCIDSLACRFASFVRTDGGGDVGGCWMGGGSVCGGDDNDDSAETEHCSMAPGC